MTDIGNAMRSAAMMDLGPEQLCGMTMSIRSCFALCNVIDLVTCKTYGAEGIEPPIFGSGIRRVAIAPRTHWWKPHYQPAMLEAFQRCILRPCDGTALGNATASKRMWQVKRADRQSGDLGQTQELVLTKRRVGSVGRA